MRTVFGFAIAASLLMGAAVGFLAVGYYTHALGNYGVAAFFAIVAVSNLNQVRKMTL